MTHHPTGHARRLQIACIAASLGLASTVAAAQSAAVAVPAPETGSETAWKPALKVGEATYGLLALQASGASASTTPRPVPGDVAARTYPRYLKSFEYAIPERFGATVKSPGLNGGGSAP